MPAKACALPCPIFSRLCSWRCFFIGAFRLPAAAWLGSWPAISPRRHRTARRRRADALHAICAHSAAARRHDHHVSPGPGSWHFTPPVTSPSPVAGALWHADWQLNTRSASPTAVTPAELVRETIESSQLARAAVLGCRSLCRAPSRRHTAASKKPLRRPQRPSRRPARARLSGARVIRRAPAICDPWRRAARPPRRARRVPRRRDITAPTAPDGRQATDS